MDTHGKKVNSWDHLFPAVEKYQSYNTTVPLHIWGYALYIAHRWIDRVRIRRAKVCGCPITFYEHSQSIVSKFKLKCPFSEAVFTPRWEEGKFLQAPEKDQEVLARAGLLAASVACADLSSNLTPPKSMDKYVLNTVILGNLHCNVYCGRTIWFNNAVNPSHHTIRWIQSNSPLMVLAINEAHRRLYCWLGPDAYVNSVHLAGFSGVGLKS